VHGQLYMQSGRWDGTSVVPSAWVESSTQPIVGTGLSGIMRNYGYCWWVAGPGPNDGILDDAVTAWGLSANFVTVVPRLQLVLVVLLDQTRTPLDRTRTGMISATDYSRVLAGLAQAPRMISPCVTLEAVD
jgi:CubicO group peptidase (beta-lactamase class C family)